MLLALMRHGAAKPAASGRRDADRPLTPEGRRRLRRLVRALRQSRLRFDRLLHSPWRRAAETAELVTPLLEGPATAEPLLARPPGADLLACLGGERPLLVGHQPWLGQTLAWLVLGRRDTGAVFEWKKGGLALLSGEPRPGRMRLVGFLPPGLVRRVGDA
jgi:phosphohistidine phosphatase